jgi:hypothetical protein
LNFSKTSFEALWLLADMVTLVEEIRNRSAEAAMSASAIPRHI